MQRLLLLLFGFVFFGPFWAQLITAGLLGWAGAELRDTERLRQAQIELMIEAPQPEPVAIEAYAGGHKSYETEVNLRVLLWTDHMTRLVRKTNFIKTGETLFVPFGPADAPAGTTVLGGLTFSKAEYEAFLSWALTQPVEARDEGLVLTLAGVLVPGDDTSHARSAMAEQGVEIASHALYLHPFLGERGAALRAFAAEQGDPVWAYGIWACAAGLGLLGVVKLRRRFRSRGTDTVAPPLARAAGPGRAEPVRAEPVKLEPVRLDPVRLGDFVREGAAAQAVTRPPSQSTSPPLLPDQPPALPRGAAPAFGVRAKRGGGYFRRLGFWLMLIVAVTVLRHGVPAAASGIVGAPLAVLSAVAVLGFTAALMGLGPRDPMAGLRAMIGHRKPAAEDPFERLHRQLRG